MYTFFCLLTSRASYLTKQVAWRKTIFSNMKNLHGPYVYDKPYGKATTVMTILFMRIHVFTNRFRQNEPLLSRHVSPTVARV